MTREKTIYERLKQQILTLQLLPGQLLDEVALSAQYGVSRTPIRDTLRRLSGEGYVVIRSHHGARVTPMEQSIRRDFLIVAPMIFTAIGVLAAQAFESSQLVELKAAHQRYATACEHRDYQAMTLENHRFHEIVGEMAANPYLAASLSRLLLDQARMELTALVERAPDPQMQGCARWQSALVSAIAERDEAGVSALLSAVWRPLALGVV